MRQLNGVATVLDIGLVRMRMEFDQPDQPEITSHYSSLLNAPVFCNLLVMVVKVARPEQAIGVPAHRFAPLVVTEISVPSGWRTVVVVVPTAGGSLWHGQEAV